MTGPVVAGIEDFEHSNRLIATAVREAESHGAPLWLAHAYHGYMPAVHGIPPGLSPEQVVRDTVTERLAILAAKVQAEHTDLRVETSAVAGPAIRALARLADRDSLLVVGGRGGAA